MKQVFRYDNDGFYLEPVILQEDEELPFNCTEIQPPNGLHKGKFINGQWIETLSQDEIDAELNAPPEKTEIEILRENQKLMQEAIDDLILSGGGF
jgi:hypothetical protein